MKSRAIYSRVNIINTPLSHLTGTDQLAQIALLENNLVTLVSKRTSLVPGSDLNFNIYILNKINKPLGGTGKGEGQEGR